MARPDDEAHRPTGPSAGPPGSADAAFRRAIAAASQGRVDEAAQAFATGIVEGPAHRGCVRGLEALLYDDVPLRPTALLAAALARAIASGTLDPRPVAARLVPHARLDAGLLHALLRATPVPDAGIEAWLRERRSRLLRAPAVTSEALAVAAQCAATEWLFEPEPGDAAAADRLRAAVSADLRAGREPDAAAALALATHGPLGRLLPDLRALPAGWPPEVAGLLAEWVVAPEEEARIAAALPSLAGDAPALGDRVRAQYERFPYPRWLVTGRREPRFAGDRLRRQDPAAEVAASLDEPVSILVAGCGTGRQALGAAQRMIHREVVGLDISRASLAYAERMRRRGGRRGVRFVHGALEQATTEDARGLLGAPFDVIECVGVLHHLADPRAGLRALVELLAPGGLLALGLYSRTARRAVAAARAVVADAAGTASLEGARAARSLLRALPSDHPARPVLGSPDLFTTSGVIDLLFHARERDYDLQEVEALLRSAGLRAVGMEGLSASVLAAFDARGASRDDLAAWAEFERERPDTFARMIQVLCVRGPGPGRSLSP